MNLNELLESIKKESYGNETNVSDYQIAWKKKGYLTFIFRGHYLHVPLDVVKEMLSWYYKEHGEL